MDWIESLNRIRNAQENNQLVIFVGAGVSANSNVPTWKNLIQQIAEEIKYSKCTNCSHKDSEVCDPKNCAYKFDFTSEEMIRIPEYFFQMDSSEDHQCYFETIKKFLKTDEPSNPIDEEILHIFPHHIITTNFDHLLESSSSVNTTLYTVVSDDRSLISNATEKYIIKMHGDIDSPESIVLKESDYLNYEQEHPLISTFIRSLLINHTFLFVGYGLNDYNLNLIISWINYFRSVHNAADTPFSFFVTDKEISEYEINRLKQKRIITVELNSIPESLINDISIPATLKNPIGRKMYFFLHAITTPEIIGNAIPLSDFLCNKLCVFSSYKRISFHDLIATCSFKQSEMLGTELIIYDKKWYDALKKILDEDYSEIKNVLQKAGITAIGTILSNQKYSISPGLKVSSILLLELSNDYQEIQNELDCNLISDSATAIYYYRLFKEQVPQWIFEKDEQNAYGGDYISILLFKVRLRLSKLSSFDNREKIAEEIFAIFKLLPNRYQLATNFLHRFFDNSSEDYIDMAKVLQKQENRFRPQNMSWESGHAFIHIWKLQSYAYDYYYYIKYNAIPIDSFKEPREYFKYYLQAILCSYSPILEKTQLSNLGFAKTDLRKYPLNEIDLDILVKYSDPKTILSWINKYSVKELIVEDSVDIEKKLTNLLRSYISFEGKNFQSKLGDFLYSLTIIISLMDNQTLFESSMSCFSEAITIIASSCPNAILKIMEPLFFLLKFIPRNKCQREKQNLLEGLVLTPIVDTIMKDSLGSIPRNLYSKTLKKLSYLKTDSITDATIQYIDTQCTDKDKCFSIYKLRALLPNFRYNQYLLENLSRFSVQDIFTLITENMLEYSSRVYDYLLVIIKKEYLSQKQNAQKGIFIAPNLLSDSIDFTILLKLAGYPVDISSFDEFKDASPFLSFLSKPDDFDYTQVDTSHYMWQNLIRSPEYQHYFIDHKCDILNDSLHTLFSNNAATEDQKKIVYGILLDKDELINW